MATLDALKEKIQALEAERLQLKDQIETLRKAAELRAAALERDIMQMHDEMKVLHEILGPSEESKITRPVSPYVLPNSSTLYTSHASPLPNASVNDSQDLLDSSTETSSVDPPDATSTYAPILETLSAEERKVVEVLIANNGTYPQRQIRNDAELSWLKTNRIITRLEERGIVTVDKTGSMDKVVLKKQIK